jgi:hypothetical protein
LAISSDRNSGEVVTPRLDSGFGRQSTAPSERHFNVMSALRWVSVEMTMTDI